ncbi:S9 family peptidase [Parashewanella curva]|uniref:S9 family peptidase n=1 Tax=Parashewanella curva TaxID=2338552 RepID=A0A3L8PUS3_9GAMM|nr:S9 family peptidase [Parashewanella curva]RLV59066.1 S9 family peptidase [Parashewanella curva]
MKKTWLTMALASVTLCISSQLYAVNLPALDKHIVGGKEPLTIERMNASPALAGKSPRGLKLSPDGGRVTYLAGRADNQSFYDLWQVDVKTGKTSILVNADKLASGELSNEEKARRERQRIYGQGIMEYQWSADGKFVLIPASGKLYLFSLSSGKVSSLPIGEGFATDAKLSPKGHFVSFIRGQNLFVLNLANKKLTALTKDGGGAIKNGMAEFVAQEEMGRYTGYWWSPDESKIAFTRVDESGVELVTRNEIYADGIKLTQQRYPYAGKTNVEIGLGIVTVKSGKTQWVDLGKNKDIYLPRVKWLPDSQNLSYQWQSRDQQDLQLRVVDVSKPKSSKVLVQERSKAWINLHKNLRFLKKQSDFLWTSERDGFSHIYLYGVDGKLKKQLTQGKWAIDAISHVDEKSGWIYFTGRKDTPVERQLYRVKLSGGNIERLSEKSGMHKAVFAKNKSIYLDYFNSLTQPPQISLHNSSGKRLSWIEQNKVVKGHPLYPYAGLWQVPEFKTLKAEDGQTLYSRLFKPVPFDANKKYPVVVRVYGGPHAQRVTNSWSSQDYFTQYLVQNGFVVFQLDNRGSANRGTKFEFPIYKHLGDVELNDQKVGVDYLRTLPFVDKKNVAIYGHSYGGYMALMGIFKAPDYFKAAISGAPVSDWHLYDTHYTERYLGNPNSNKKGYELSSVMPYVKGYQSGLLMYHGMADDNVLFENSTRVYKALQDEGKLFQMIDYPGSKHSMRGEKVRNHLYKSLADFLNKELK